LPDELTTCLRRAITIASAVRPATRLDTCGFAAGYQSVRWIFNRRRYLGDPEFDGTANPVRGQIARNQRGIAGKTRDVCGLKVHRRKALDIEEVGVPKMLNTTRNVTAVNVGALTQGKSQRFAGIRIGKSDRVDPLSRPANNRSRRSLLQYFVFVCSALRENSGKPPIGADLNVLPFMGPVGLGFRP
jgi:hypothetical protein